MNFIHKFFPNNPPARSTPVVGLPLRELHISIECMHWSKIVALQLRDLELLSTNLTVFELGVITRGN
jgi:hypothetical protein